MGEGLKRRLARLEREVDPHEAPQVEQWRAQLAEQFAEAKYDTCRAALIAALCSDRPRYDVHLPSELNGYPATEHHFISWYERDQGAPVIHVFIMPDPEDDPHPE